MIRRRLLLGASFLLLVVAACDSNVEVGPWLVERGASASLDEAIARSSVGNVSRPAVVEGGALELHGEFANDALVEWELGPALEGVTDPVLEVVQGAERRALIGERLPQAGTQPSAWRRFRAALGDVHSPATLAYSSRDSANAPLRSRPRILARRDNAERLNVVWIVLDTVRADYLGCYGHDRPTSPRIDELAQRSLVFERAISPASWTLPAMSSMFTGLYSESHGVVHTEQRLDGRFLSFVELFAQAGYSTGAVVSGTFTDSFWGFDQGFDEYDDLGMVVDDERGGSIEIAAMEAQAHRRITSPEVTDRALAFLERNEERRFFLLAHYFDPHQDFVQHPGFSEAFGARPADSPRFGKMDPSPDATARLRGAYEGEIAFTDHHIGRLLQRLEAAPFAGKVAVLITADHGEEFYERQWLGHGNSLFDELVHVPFILYVPGVSSRRIAAPVTTLDIAPTLLELCGLTDTFGQGQSLVPFLVEGEGFVGGEGFAAGESLEGGHAVTERAVFASLFAALSPAPGEIGEQIAFRVDQREDAVVRDERLKEIPFFLFHWPTDPLQDRNLGQRRSARANELLAIYEGARPGLLTLRGRPDLLQLSPAMLETLRGLGYVGSRPKDE